MRIPLSISPAILATMLGVVTLLPLAGSSCRYVEVGKPTFHGGISLNSPITFEVDDKGNVTFKAELDQVIGPFRVQAGLAMPLEVNPDGRRLVIAFRDRAAEILGIDSYFGIDPMAMDLVPVVDGSRAFEPGRPLIIDISDHRPREVLWMPRQQVPPNLTLEPVPDEAIDGGNLEIATEPVRDDPTPAAPTEAVIVDPTTEVVPEASPWPCGEPSAQAAFGESGGSAYLKLAEGDCTTIQWSSCQAVQVVLDGETVAEGPEAAASGQWEICPETAREYVLDFMDQEGRGIAQHRLNVQVVRYAAPDTTLEPTGSNTVTPSSENGTGAYSSAPAYP